MTQRQTAPQVLVIDDDPAVLRMLKAVLTRAGCEVEATADPLEGVELARSGRFDLLLVDLQMPVLGGLDVLQELRGEGLASEIVIMTAHASMQSAVEALKAGAADYLVKPFENIEEVVLRVERAAERRQLRLRTLELERRLSPTSVFEDLIGQSQSIQQVYRWLETVARTSATVLLQGESGTGKELVARALHRRGPRSDRPFLPINCSALSEALLETELFGHEKGAFAGAHVLRRGLFEAADGGTLFLDEIGDITPGLQARLLRVLQFGEVSRAGAGEPIPVDVRVIAATHRELELEVRRGRFREDLYQRLNVVGITLPPLRDRAEDVAPLSYYFLRRSAQRHQKPMARITTEALQLLERWPWPGNVRELENAIERAVVMSQEETLSPADLPPAIVQGQIGTARRAGSLSHLPYLEAKSVNQASFERRYLKDLLRRNTGNITRAARAAGMDRSNFRRLMKAAGVEPDAVLDDSDDGVQ